MKNRSNIIAIIILFTLIIIMILVKQSVDTIKNDGIVTYGIVYKISKFNRDHSYYVYYYVNGKEYEYRISTNNSDMIDKVQEGDSLKIYYLEENPSEAWGEMEFYSESPAGL